MIDLLSLIGTAVTNLVNSSGVVASDVSGVGSVRLGLAAAGYACSRNAFYIVQLHAVKSNVLRN